MLDARLNEFHYDNVGTDVGEFVEVRVNSGASVSGLQLDLYNGNGGGIYATMAVSSGEMSTDGAWDYYVLDVSGIQNGPDGIALSNNGSLIEFVSYEGQFTATDGPATGTMSIDIGVEEGGTTAVGSSLQRNNSGDAWVATDGSNTFGDANNTAQALLISDVQGSGSASFYEGEYVLLSAIVTYTVSNGFYLQEEDSDSDGNAATSEGIFVFTGGAPGVMAGDQVDLNGLVAEFNGLTEITDLVSLDIISSGNDLPDYTDVMLPRLTAEQFESVEGMRVALSSSTLDPITIIENFNLARYGEIVVSAGIQTQPTQIYDAQTEQAQIQALMEANSLNRLIIDDGLSTQNPTSFEYIANHMPGDNGNGYLDSGDIFTDMGPTLRLGSEMLTPVEGVMTYQFGDYTMLVDGTLPIDESTNSGARQLTPDDVGGSLQVGSVNLLNYFTTLDDGSGGSGPNNLEPRGATTQADLDRQTAKAVEAILGTGAEVLGLQELENGGFGSDSAIQTLIDALNDESGQPGRFAFVDPTDDGGFIGDDAITTGMIYDTTKVQLLGSAFYVFEEQSSEQTETNTGLNDLQRNRPAIAASFVELETGGVFTMVVNHFKSKGDSGLSGSAPGDDPNVDQGDGQGYWNQVRLDAAHELAAWLATNPTGVSDSDVMIVGDLNSYAEEDPVQALENAGYQNLIDQFIGNEEAYSYVFDGQQGTLDQGLASTSLASQVTGLTEWHINSDEPGLLSYSSEFTDPAFYNVDPFAASDHDPLIIGLDLSSDLIMA